MSRAPGCRPSREDFWRIDPAGSAAPFKEWQHFVLSAPGLDLLLNFSLSSVGPGRPPKARLIVLAHTTRWHGFVQDVAEFWLSPDGCRAQLGGHRYIIDDGQYRIEIDAPDHAVAAELRLRPCSAPMTVRNQPIAAGRRLHWLLHARLEVEGSIEVAGHAFELGGAWAYHDHNWGNFAWGEDLSWEWGVMSAGADCPSTVVYSLLTDRGRGLRRLEHLLLWDGPVHAFLAEAAELRVLARGRWHPPARFQVPASLALLHTRRDEDVPRRLELSAESGADRVCVSFEPALCAQLLIPSESQPLGLVRINECLGRARVRGRVQDRSLDWEGRGVFEFVRH